MTKGVSVELSQDNITDIISRVVNNESDNSICLHYGIGWHRLKSIINKHQKEIDNLKDILASERQKKISPMLLRVVCEGLTEILEGRKIRKAKFGELSRGIEALYKTFRLSTDRSTDNVAVKFKDMSDEDLDKYIIEGESKDE